MKHYPFRSIAVVALSFFANFALAEKIAVVDGQALLQNIPQNISFEAELKKEFQPRQQEIEGLQASLREKGQALQKQRLTLKPDELTKKETELQSLQETLQRKTRIAQQDLRARQEELQGKLEKIITTAISAVSEKKKVDIVLFKGAVAWQKTGAVVDLTESVIEHLKTKK